jgi:16S rRNA (guanine1207-N2)-methyltransferase
MPDTPAHRLARFVAEAIQIVDAERFAVYSPYAAELVEASAGRLGGAALHLVTHDLRDAERAAALRDALRPSDREAIFIHTGEGLTSLSVRPDVALLWPSGWEGHAPLRAQALDVFAALPHGGRLYVLVSRARGALALLDMLRRNCGGARIDARGPGGFCLLLAMKGDLPPVVDEEGVDDQARDGRLLIETELAGKRFAFRTAPGVFSHLTMDAGTRYFLETLLARESEALTGCSRVLDLGCGYGPIGIILAAIFPHLRLVLSDVDSRAVGLARENVALNGVVERVEVRLSEGLRHLDEVPFDAIVSHFPLHLRREGQLALLREAQAGLAPGGRLYLSTLAAYDVRPAVRQLFGDVRTVAEGLATGGDRYRVVTAL